MRRLVVCVVAFVIPSASSFAAEPAKKPEVVRLAITPAVEPMPLLKYQLLPKFIDRRPGNAAVDYGRAFAQLAQVRDGELKFEEEWTKWLDLPLDEFEQAIQGRDLATLGGIGLVRHAARCNSCDWQLPLRDQPFYMILLPQLHEMRRLARRVALQVRLKTLEGKYDEAVELLQVGYAMARHAAVEPTLVSGLVGVSITATMDRARLDLLQRSGAPSLYWAETFLPRPLIDPRPGVEAEMYALALSFPALQEAERSPEEWTVEAQKLLGALPELMAMASEDASHQQWSALLSSAFVMGKVALRRDELRAYLVRHGRAAKEVEAMQDPQLMLEYTRLKYEELRDEMISRLMLPYADSKAEMEAAEGRLRKAKADSEEVVPLATYILPAVASLAHSYARADRRRDVLRIIEALRLHLAKHDGKLPKSLAEITDVPLPQLDVVTGKSFDYVLDGGVARLTLPHENRTDATAIHYEITAAK